MGWTWNQKRRESRRRNRPLLENLDDRCLLSGGVGIPATEHLLVHKDVHRHVVTSIVHGRSDHKGATHKAADVHKKTLKSIERPAGTLISGTATVYDPIVGAATTRSAYQVDGTGMTVAVIDTGVDYNNPALGGGFGPGDKVVAGFDFATGTADPMATNSQHGTAIAGLIASSDPNDLGVAPGADIVALRVTDGTDTASLSSIASALQWVITNHAKYNITSVNMSLSDGGNYAQNWFANDGGEGEQITNLIGQLTSMNIPVIAATGNSFNGLQGEGFAAIVQGTISVTATDLSGNLLSNAQRLGTAIGGASATTIAAPGAQLTAPSGDSGTTSVEGTSFATALVTGGVTLLQEIYESRFGTLPTVAEIKSWLQAGATPINDPVTGITIGELNIAASAALIPQATVATPTPPPVSTPVQVSSPITTSPTSTTVATATPTTPVTSTTTSTSTSTDSASSDSTSTSTSSIEVFVNGQEVQMGNSSTTLGALDESLYDELLMAMNSWASSDPNDPDSTAAQVQVWSASTASTG